MIKIWKITENWDCRLPLKWREKPRLWICRRSSLLVALLISCGLSNPKTYLPALLLSRTPSLWYLCFSRDWNFASDDVLCQFANPYLSFLYGWITFNLKHEQMLECLFGFLSSTLFCLSSEIQLLFYLNQIKQSHRRWMCRHSFNELVIPTGNTRQTFDAASDRDLKIRMRKYLLPRSFYTAKLQIWKHRASIQYYWKITTKSCLRC